MRKRGWAEREVLIDCSTLLEITCPYIVAAKQTPCLLCRRQGVKSRRGIAFVGGLVQIDELFAVANVDVSFYRLRHCTAVQVVEGSFFSLLLYVLHGRNDKATEELRSSTGRLGLSEVGFSGR